MSSVETSGKVTAGHLSRTAYLYVRQSTLRQVVHNTESATRQRGCVVELAGTPVDVVDVERGNLRRPQNPRRASSIRIAKSRRPHDVRRSQPASNCAT